MSFLKNFYKGKWFFHYPFYYALLKLFLKTIIKRKTRNLFLSPGKIFDSIAIETISNCNRKCKYCPVSYTPRKEIEMDSENFYSIIDELSSYNYNGIISLNNFNEPLLDKRISDFVSYAKKKCPKSFIEFSSNGDFLDYKALKKLVDSGLDLIFVTRYSDKIENSFLELYDSLNFFEKTKILLRAKKNFSTNRAGNIPFMQINKPINIPCYLPFYQLVIGFNGRAVICCSDYFGKEIVGNTKNQSLKEIWLGKKLETIRGFLKKGKREKISVCAKCNFLSNVNPEKN